jgi:hypothetical protein
MKSLEKMVIVAGEMERKWIRTGQVVGAQAADIEAALAAARLWDLSAQVSPLLNQAGVPDSASVAVSIVADKMLNINFLVSTNPPHASAAKLAQILKNIYATKMKAALQAAKLSVTDIITVKWLSF